MNRPLIAFAFGLLGVLSSTASWSANELCTRNWAALYREPMEQQREIVLFRDDFEIGRLPQDRYLLGADDYQELFRSHGVKGDPYLPDVSGDYAKVTLLKSAPQGSVIKKAPRPTAPEGKYTRDQKLKVFRAHLRALQGDGFSDSMLDVSVKLIGQNENAPEITNALIEYEVWLKSPTPGHPFESIASSGRTLAIPGSGASAKRETVELATAGENRYFWFKPEGSDTLVPARVLDVHKFPPKDRFEVEYNQRYQDKLTVLTEWFTEAPGGGARVRHVGSIQKSEIDSISGLSSKDRMAAAEKFFESLTPQEVKTAVLAESLGLKAQGYSDFLRAPNVSGGAYSPTEKMTLDGHVGIRRLVEENFGSYDDVMTAAERANPRQNPLDVFSRMTAREVLDRFVPNNPNARYIFVITEDGKLKVAPYGSVENNLRPLLLRLGHGRKILAAGEFSQARNGELSVTLRSDNYASVEGRFADQAGHLGQNDNVNHFVRATMELQGGRRVGSIGSRTAESWDNVVFNDVKGKYEYADGPDMEFKDPYQASADKAKKRGAGGERAERGRQHYDGHESREQKDFFDSFFTADNTELKQLDWARDRKDAAPLSFEKWVGEADPAISRLTGKAKKEEIDRATRYRGHRMQWAHYVLGTTPDSTLAEIKASYRKLAALFHPKMEKDSDVTSKLVNEAYTLIKADAKIKAKD
ncbi:MAG: J domain-containing protein [Oligoflexia bacterium]|nr:J domain-containing protein [Oligoflexia bacterium]